MKNGADISTSKELSVPFGQIGNNIAGSECELSTIRFGSVLYRSKRYISE